MAAAGALRTPIEAALVGRLLERPPTAARLPVGALTREEEATELQRVQAHKAVDAAYEAELVPGLADDTPDTLDPPPDQPGARTGSWAPEPELPGVSQFFPSELAVVLSCGRGTASHTAHRAWTYRLNVPATWAALTDGVLDEARAKVLADVLQHTAPEIARAVEAIVLPEATHLSTGAAQGTGAGAAARVAAQHALVTTRDRDCRFPNCGQRVGWADRDHVIPHAHGGATDCADLCCLCRSHRRLKTLARGWRFVMDDDGALHVTTPSGVTRTTRPPGLRGPAPDPPAPDPPEPEGDPRSAPPPRDDPPPF
jgi:hypothetical protein